MILTSYFTSLDLYFLIYKIKNKDFTDFTVLLRLNETVANSQEVYLCYCCYCYCCWDIIPMITVLSLAAVRDFSIFLGKTRKKKHRKKKKKKNPQDISHMNKYVFIYSANIDSRPSIWNTLYFTHWASYLTYVSSRYTNNHFALRLQRLKYMEQYVIR